MVAAATAGSAQVPDAVARPYVHDVISSDEIEELVLGDKKQQDQYLRTAFEKREAPGIARVESGVATTSWMCSLGSLLNVEEDTENSLGMCTLLCKTSDLKLGTGRKPFQLDEHNSTGFIEDGDSIASLSTLGRGAFGDLRSIPSVADSQIKLLENVNVEDEIDDTSTIGSIGDVSGLSLPVKQDEDDATLVTVDLSIGDRDDSVVQSVKSESQSTTPGKGRVHFEIANGLDRISALSKKLLSKKANKTDQEESNPGSKALQQEKLKSRRNGLIRDLRKMIDSFGRYDIRCANIAAAISDVFTESKEHEHALKMREEAFIIYRTKLGDHHVTTVDAKVKVGKAMEKVGDYDGALETFFVVYSMRKAIQGAHDSSIPEALVLVAGALKRKGRATQAIREMKRALKLFRESLGDAHPFVTEAVEEIASLYITVGDYQKAAMINEELVKLRAATDGTNNEGVGRSLLELATAYEAAGEYDKGMKALKKACTVFTTLHGENSSQAADCLERVAQNYSATRDPENAVTAYLGVLQKRKHSFGNSDPMVADTYLNLGIALRANIQYDKAMKCMKNALSIFVGEGRDMNDVGMIAEVMHEMAMTHRCKGQLGEAVKLLKQELTIRQKMGSRELPAMAKALHHLGSIELTLMNNTQALNFFMEALSIYEKLESGLGVDFAETLYSTGLVFEATRHEERAKEAFTEALRIFRAKGLSETSDLVQNVKWKLERHGSARNTPRLDTRNDSSAAKIG